jgi:hypothetical protein
MSKINPLPFLGKGELKTQSIDLKEKVNLWDLRSLNENSAVS